MLGIVFSLCYTLIPLILNNSMQYHYCIHFTDEEVKVEWLRNLPKVRQLHWDLNPGIWHQSLCTLPLIRLPGGTLVTESTSIQQSWLFGLVLTWISPKSLCLFLTLLDGAIPSFFVSMCNLKILVRIYLPCVRSFHLLRSQDLLYLFSSGLSCLRKEDSFQQLMNFLSRFTN